MPNVRHSNQSKDANIATFYLVNVASFPGGHLASFPHVSGILD
jgi:hypothetical protein